MLEPRISFSRIPFILLITLVFGVIVSQNASAQTDLYIIDHTWDGVALAEVDIASVEVSWMNNGDLKISVEAPFANDPQPNCDQLACWELWNYEVVELFLVGAGDPVPYTEIEISPWGNHLVLQLLGNRNVTAQELPLELTVKRDGARWTAVATVSKDILPVGDLTVNAYRVSGVEPSRNYHVMTPMVGDKPDFHHIDQFTRSLKRQ